LIAEREAEVLGICGKAFVRQPARIDAVEGSEDPPRRKRAATEEAAARPKLDLEATIDHCTKGVS